MPGSVSNWLASLKAGDDEAAQALWERYFQTLVQRVRQNLDAIHRGLEDEEDIALSAMDSLFRGARAGKFPQLNDRQDLWRLLTHITNRKLIDRGHHEQRQKRGGPGFAEYGDGRVWRRIEFTLEELVAVEPTPEFALQMAEEYHRLLQRLPDSGLRQIAVWKMEGDTVPEIAARLGCVPRTVERKLKLIRTLWSKDYPP
jgi:DNA-directed RNA polymerase specialized sigma24 family protein